MYATALEQILAENPELASGDTAANGTVTYPLSEVTRTNEAIEQEKRERNQKIVIGILAAALVLVAVLFFAKEFKKGGKRK